MYQVPTEVWNEIAQTQTLATRWASILFNMDDAVMEEKLERLGDKLEARGFNATTIRAYQQMAPLLAENVAISHYLMETGRFGLRGALPEVVTVAEAVMLATLEWRLDATEQKDLTRLLANLSD